MERAATLRLTLVRSLEDDATFSPGYQAELKQFYSLVRAEGTRMNAVTFTMPGAVNESGFTGEFVVPLAQLVGPVLGRAACAWLHGRAGRVVRLTMGNLDFDVNTPDELDALIQRFTRRPTVTSNDT